MSEHLDHLRSVRAATPAAPSEMALYLSKVHERAYTVTDADIESLKATGIDEDTIFEQTVAAALGEGLRRLDAATEAIG